MHRVTPAFNGPIFAWGDYHFWSRSEYLGSSCWKSSCLSGTRGLLHLGEGYIPLKGKGNFLIVYSHRVGIYVDLWAISGGDATFLRLLRGYVMMLCWGRPFQQRFRLWWNQNLRYLVDTGYHPCLGDIWCYFNAFRSRYVKQGPLPDCFVGHGLEHPERT